MNQQIRFPSFVSFFASPAGRWTRIIAGAAMIGAGLAQKSSTGKKVAAFGIIPLLAGSFDICVLAPLFGATFSGAKTRQMLNTLQGHPELGSRHVKFRAENTLLH
jgi:hypothetical protein